MDWSLLIIIFNGIFLFAAAVLLAVMIRTVVQFNWAFGDGEKQGPLQFKFLKLLLLMVLLGFVAAIGNIFLSWI